VAGPARRPAAGSAGGPTARQQPTELGHSRRGL